MQRKTFVRAALAAVVLAADVPSYAQPDPSKPVRVVIPFPPGGTLDTVGRMLAQKLRSSWASLRGGEPTGGNGLIGADAVAKSPPTATRCCSTHRPS